MGKFAFYILIIFISLAQASHSQSNVQLFSDYLPEEYLKDEDKLEQVEINLNYYAEINPDLIYYFLNYLDALVNKKISDRDSNYYSILQYEISKSNKLNNTWVGKQLDKIQNLTESDLIIDELESLIDEFEVPETYAPEIKINLAIDNNLQKFYTYKCLTGDKDLNYDENTNYYNLVEDVIRKIISEVSEAQNLNGSDAYDIRNDKYQELLRYHIFSKGFSDGTNREIDFDLVQFLISLIDYTEFREYNGLTFNFSAQGLRSSFPDEKLTEPYFPYYNFSIQNSKNTLMFYDVSMGYRLKFTEFKKSLSHLDMNIGWSFGSQKEKNKIESQSIDKYYFIWEGEPGNFTFLFNGTINSASWKINKFSSVSAKVSTPIYYYNQKLSIVLGLEYEYLFWETSATINREIIEQISVDDPGILGPEVEEIKHTANKQLFGGSFTINYSIINSLSVKATISTFPSVQAGLEYFLPL
jgi:hypothetical protein